MAIATGKRTQKYLYEEDDNIRSVIEKEIERLGSHADLNHIDLSEVTDLSSLFTDLDFDGDISKWDVSHITDMSHMFERSNFNGDISNWDVRNVRKHDGCFDDSPLQNQPYKQPKFIS